MRYNICNQTNGFISMPSYRIELSELPLTTKRSRYCKQAIPRLWPFNVRTNSQLDAFHTLIVRSPDADTMYFSSKSTTFTAARCPTKTRRIAISFGAVISHTAIDRSWNNVALGNESQFINWSFSRNLKKNLVYLWTSYHHAIVEA